MCSLVVHDKMQPNHEDDESSLGDRTIPKDATTTALKALGATINFIDIWLKLFLDHYNARCDAYVNAMKQMFKQIPLTMKKVLNPKQKVQKLVTDIGGGWYMEKLLRGYPHRITELSKNTQGKQDGIHKELYEANKWWNDWRFQLYWNNIEWVNPRSLIKRDKPYSVSSETIYFNKNDRTAHWVGLSKLK